MKRVLGILTGALLMVAVPAMAHAGQDKDKKEKATSAKTMTAMGTVASVSNDSLTVKGKTGEWTFAVDSKTKVTAKGGGHKAADMKAAKQPTTITDFVKTGDTVRVAYHDMGATKHAATVSVVSSTAVK